MTNCKGFWKFSPAYEAPHTVALHLVPGQAGGERTWAEIKINDEYEYEGHQGQQQAV